MVRAHTLGVSTGNEDSFQQEAGSTTFNTAALDSVDYAVYQASLRGIRFIVPLTDNYNYYHGGYHDFTDYQASKVWHQRDVFTIIQSVKTTKAVCRTRSPGPRC